MQRADERRVEPQKRKRSNDGDRQEKRQLRLEFTVLLTAKTMHSIYSSTRRKWLAL